MVDKGANPRAPFMKEVTAEMAILDGELVVVVVGRPGSPTGFNTRRNAGIRKRGYLRFGNEFGENLIAMCLANAVGLDFPGRR